MRWIIEDHSVDWKRAFAFLPVSIGPVCIWLDYYEYRTPANAKSNFERQYVREFREIGSDKSYVYDTGACYDS